MKIIANSAWLESAKAEKSLEIANDADVAELVASGALQGIEQVQRRKCAVDGRHGIGIAWLAGQ